MSKIKFGDIDYFCLLDLQDKLKYIGYNRLDLEFMDKLRGEIHIKIRAIHIEHERENNIPCSHEWVDLNDDTDICAKCGNKK